MLINIDFVFHLLNFHAFQSAAGNFAPRFFIYNSLLYFRNRRSLLIKSNFSEQMFCATEARLEKVHSKAKKFQKEALWDQFESCATAEAC